MRKFVCTHDPGSLDVPKVEAIRRAFENSPEIIVTKCWFSLSSGKIVTEVEAASEDVATGAFDKLELPASSIMEASALLQRARVIHTVHT